MTNELLEYDDMNVVVIDWVGGSGPPYTQAVANIRLIGVMTAHLIKMLMVRFYFYCSFYLLWWMDNLHGRN